MIANDPYLAMPEVIFFFNRTLSVVPTFKSAANTKWPRCRDWSTVTKCNQMVNKCIVRYKLRANRSGYCPKSKYYNAFPDLTTLCFGQQFSNLDLTLIWIVLKQFFMKRNLKTFYREVDKNQITCIGHSVIPFMSFSSGGTSLLRLEIFNFCI